MPLVLPDVNQSLWAVAVVELVLVEKLSIKLTGRAKGRALPLSRAYDLSPAFVFKMP